MSLSPGQSATVAVSAGALANSTGSVAVSLSGLPAGISADPLIFAVGIGSSQSVRFSAAAGAKAVSGTVTANGTSGENSHTATLPVAIAVAPAAADFSIAVTPAVITFVAGTVSQAVSVSVNGLGGFVAPVAVSLTGLPPGVVAVPASLTISPGAPQSVTFTAPPNTAAESGTVVFTGTSGSLTHTANLAIAITSPPVPLGVHDVTTYHYDTMRTGLNAGETILTPANVNASAFGKIGFDPVDGLVDAQPLYLSAVTVAGALHNTLYVATENDSVYAFDADSGAQLWMVTALGTGETPSDDHGCGQITPEIGITATPVIDRTQGPNGTIYLVAMTKDSNNAYHQRLHALDAATGAELLGGPTELAATYPGNGVTSANGVNTFAPGSYAERASLLLLNGTVYLSWTSHCDIPSYTGWVMGYSETTLRQTAVLNLTPNGSDGSIWMSGGGLAADAAGSIYLLDANGTFDTSLDANGFPIHGDFGNSFLKLSTANGALAVADYFEPMVGPVESAHDTDFGSGEAMVLPDLAAANGSALHLAVGAGKDTNIYFVNRDNMGKFSPAANNVFAELSQIEPNGVWSTPAYFNGTVYMGGVGDVLKAFAVLPSGTSTPIPATPSSTTAQVFPYPGTSPSISANGVQGGIVWALESGPGAPGVLHAYDATNLATELYNSNQAPNGRDAFGTGNKFITPVVANGKVYVGTPAGVAVFGELTP